MKDKSCKIVTPIHTKSVVKSVTFFCLLVHVKVCASRCNMLCNATAVLSATIVFIYSHQLTYMNELCVNAALDKTVKVSSVFCFGVQLTPLDLSK